MVGGNGFAGNMFDISPTSDMTISSIDINSNDVAGTALTFDVWYIPGTCVGNTNNPTAWTLLGSYTATAAGAGLPTSVDMTGNGMTWIGGSSYGMYVDMTSYHLTPSYLRYTDGPSGGSVFSNADLSIHTYYGNSNTNVNGPFTQGVISFRDWNGTIHYDMGPSTPVLSVTGLAGGSTATLSVAGATPAGGVLIGYSLAGAGPTPTPFGLVDMSPPINQLPTLTADANGDAAISTGVPGQATGFTVYMQSADLASGVLSNSLAEVVL